MTTKFSLVIKIRVNYMLNTLLAAATSGLDSSDSAQGPVHALLKTALKLLLQGMDQEFYQVAEELLEQEGH